MRFHHKYDYLPLLIYLSFMDPLIWIHWVGLGLLLLTGLNRSDYNLMVIPFMLLAVLPSLYLSLISWQLFFAVAFSFPLYFKRGWLEARSTLIVALYWVAPLAFFAGALAPWVVLLALWLFLPKKTALAGMLVFMILVLLPLGRSDWKAWLGEGKISSQNTVHFDHGTGESPALEQPFPMQAQLTEYPWTPFMEILLHMALFSMYVLMLLLLLRVLWMMRRRWKILSHAVLKVVFFIIGGTLLFYPIFWMRKLMPFKELAGSSPLIPSEGLNSPALPDPSPGVVPDPASSLPTEATSELVETSTQLSGYDFVANLVIIFLIVLICCLLFLLIKRIWTTILPEKPLKKGKAQLLDLEKKDTENWKVLNGEQLLLRGYEALRQCFFAAREHSTPLELKITSDLKEFHWLTDAYMSFQYRLKGLAVPEEILRGWIHKCFEMMQKD